MISQAELEQLVGYAERLPHPGEPGGLKKLVTAMASAQPVPTTRVVTKVVRVPMYLPAPTPAPGPMATLRLTLAPPPAPASPGAPPAPTRIERTVERNARGLIQRVVSDTGAVTEVLRDRQDNVVSLVRTSLEGPVVRATIHRDRDQFIAGLTERVQRP